MNSSLNVTAVVNDEVAAVEVAGVTVEGFYADDLQASGWAKKHPHDKANPEIAFHLAMARALQDLATQYARAAADLAGFPVVVDLDGVEVDGQPVVIEHHPLTPVDIEEEVSY